MKLLEKIVLPVYSFTNVSDKVLDTAILVAKVFGSQITLVHGEMNSVEADNGQDVDLRKMSTKIVENGICAGYVMLESGNFAEQIIKYADSNGVNLIITGSGEESKYGELDNDVKNLVLKSEIPVWVVRMGVGSEIKRILCPVEFSDFSCGALRNAIHLARSFGAVLTVLHVTETTDGSSNNTGHGKSLNCVKEEVELDNLLKDFNFSDVTWDKVVCSGVVYQEILKAKYDSDADVVVMWAAGLSRAVSGDWDSTVERVINEVPCSVVIVKSNEIIQAQGETVGKDIDKILAEGKMLMEKGFYGEALKQFSICLDIDPYFEPAWECSVNANERSGNDKEAEECRKQLKLVKEKHWQQQVMADIRSHHSAFNKHN